MMAFRSFCDPFRDEDCVWGIAVLHKRVVEGAIV